MFQRDCQGHIEWDADGRVNDRKRELDALMKFMCEGCAARFPKKDAGYRKCRRRLVLTGGAGKGKRP